MAAGRSVRIAGLIVLGALALAAVAVAIFVATFDANSLKPRIADAVRRATGRDLAIDGDVTLVPSLRPTIAVGRVALANVAGGSRPAMATAQRIEVRLALLPLLSRQVEIERVVIQSPDILLETGANGTPNWVFGPAVPAQKLPDAPASPPEARRPLSVIARDVEIDQGTATYRDARTGSAYTLTIAQARATMADAAAPVQIAIAGAYDGATFSATGSVDPSREAVALHVGAADLGRLRPGLALTALDIPATRADEPVKLTATGTLGDLPLSLQASTGTPAALSARSAPIPFALALNAGAATASATGTVADPAHLAGVSAALAASIPDLASLSPLAGERLPALREVTFKGALSDASAQGFTLKGLSFAAAQADAAGDLAARMGARPSVQATLTSKRIDLDALRAAFAQPAAAPSASPAPAPAAAPAHPAPATGHVIPDTELPLEGLRRADADLRLTAATILSGGATYRDLSGHLTLTDGALKLDPFAATLPEGKLTATLAIDAGGERPPVSLSLHAPGLALKPLLTALALPDDVAGAVEIDADIRGAGRSPHQIASTADGAIGLAMVDGRIDNRLVQQSLGEVARRAGLPDLLGRGGSSALRCFAARLDLQRGRGELRTLLLDTAIIQVDGSGSLDLGSETLNLRITPLARVGGTGVMVPLEVTGGFRSPLVAVDARAAATEAAGLAAGAAPRGGALAGIVIGALGGDRMIKGAGGQDCGAALAIARGGRAGRQPSAPAPADAKARAPNPADLLGRFLR
jgi:AsmA protein